MKRVYLRVIACTLSVVLLYPAFVVVSQTNTGLLSGVVTSFSSSVIPNAEVWATRKSDRRASFETRTDDSGKFLFTNLPPDVYQVTVRQESGVTVERMISVSPGRMAQMDISLGTGCDNVPEGKVSDADKAEVFRSMLTRIAAPESGLLEQKQRETGVILSTKNIKPAWLQGFQGLSIQLWAPNQIQRKADNEGDFMFLSVPEMKVRRQCIAVTMGITWAQGKNSKAVYMSGGGLVYEYRLESGKWVGKLVTGWVI